jgi:hypothetical protein
VVVVSIAVVVEVVVEVDVVEVEGALDVVGDDVVGGSELGSDRFCPAEHAHSAIATAAHAARRPKPCWTT